MCTSRHAWHCSRVSQPTVCPTRLVRLSHRMYTLKLISLVHWAVHQVRNGVHTRVPRRRLDLLRHHLPLATTGVAIAWQNCRTLRCRRNLLIHMISVTVCLDLRHNSSNRRLNSRRWHHDSPALLARTQCANIKSLSVRRRPRIVASHLRPRTNTPLRTNRHLSTSRLRTHLMVRTKVRRSRRCRLHLHSVRRPVCLRRLMPCRHRQVKDRCRHTPGSLAHVPRLDRS